VNRSKIHPLSRYPVLAAIMALGLLAPTVGRAAAPTYTFKKLFAQGDPPGSVVGDIELIGLNNLDHFPFTTEMGGNEGIFWWDGTASKLLEPAASIWNPGGVNDQDQVVAIVEAGSDNHSETHFYDVKKGTSKVLTKPGMPVPGGGTISASSTQYPSTQMNQKGEIVTTVDVDDGSTAVILIELDGTMTRVAGKGTAVPGGKTLDQATFGALNDNGQIVFTDQPANADGNSIYLSDKDTISLIAAPGMTPAGAGAALTNAVYPYINNDGDVVFRGAMGDNQGLFLWQKATGLKTIAKTGDTLPGGGTFQQVEATRRHSAVINNKGQVAALIWIGDTDGGALTYNLADGSMNVVARTGQALPGIGKITAMGLSRGDTPVTSWNMAINDNGDLLFAAQIDSGKEDIILATP
jgi:hypothetical protein